MKIRSLKGLISMLAMMATMTVSADAADITVPARFRIGSDVVWTNIGPFSTCVTGGEMFNYRTSIGYEPFAFRYRFFPVKDDTNRIWLAGGAWEKNLASGFWDGAKVRVCRIVNGKWTVVREGEVPRGGHQAEEWSEFKTATYTTSGRYVPPSVKQFTFGVPLAWKRGAQVWISMSAVDKYANFSSPSAAASFRVSSAPVTKETKEATGDTLASGTFLANVVQPKKGESVPADPKPIDTEPPLPPTEVSVQYNEAAGTATLVFKPSVSDDVIGYRCLVSAVPPERLTGRYVRIAPDAKTTSEHIRAQDWVFVDQVRTTLTPDLFQPTAVSLLSEAPFIPYVNDPTSPNRWSLVPHPGKLPTEFKDHGKTCLQLDLKEKKEKPFEIEIDRFQGAGGWYGAPKPGTKMRVEFWARQEGMEDSTITLVFQGSAGGRKTIPSKAWNLAKEWTRYTYEYTHPGLSDNITYVKLTFNGPGTLWIDDVRQYDATLPFMGTNERIKELADSKMRYWRDHTHIKSGFSYYMNELLNPAGVVGYRGLKGAERPATLESVLRGMRDAGLQPWLQVEMCQTADEWLALIEYLAAPWDPAKDTPQSKPWAWRRVQQGQATPWADVFERFMFEVSNETWNPLFSPWNFGGVKMTDSQTGKQYVSGQIYGLYQEWLIALFRSSPYWSRLGKKSEFMIGGWASGIRETSYGPDAMPLTPNSKYVAIASYVGGYDEGEGTPGHDAAGWFSVLMASFQGYETRARLLLDVKAKQKLDWIPCTYEGGPGYNMGSLPGEKPMTKEEKEQQARLKCSQSSGVASLDTFLTLAYYGGMQEQAYYAFNSSTPQGYFASHARWDCGGAATPSWKLLSLYNKEGTGDFLKVDRESVPTADLPKLARRKESKDAPVAACYATRKGDRINVFVISRKVPRYPVASHEGWTPVTLELPFSTAKRITLHKMAGSLEAENLLEDKVKIVTEDIPAKNCSASFKLTSATGADDRGIPPGSMFLYVFEGVK